MLVEIYIEALLADEVLADEVLADHVWEVWYAGLIDNDQAAQAWLRVAVEGAMHSRADTR